MFRYLKIWFATKLKAYYHSKVFCTWYEPYFNNNFFWVSDCVGGQYQIFSTPAKSKMVYCPSCGRKIKPQTTPSVDDILDVNFIGDVEISNVVQVETEHRKVIDKILKEPTDPNRREVKE